MVYGLILLLLFAACGEDKPQPLSIQVVPAKLIGDTKGSEYANWDTVEFTGGGGAITYLVASEPLLTEWNIVACKIADGGSQTKIVAARLNAYGSKKMQNFSENTVNLKQPLGLKIGDRWQTSTPCSTRCKTASSSAVSLPPKPNNSSAISPIARAKQIENKIG